MSTFALPVLADNNLSSYIAQVNRFPMLSEAEELRLAKRLAEHNDIEAAHTLVTSHLRLVVKIAMGFRGYGLPVADIISEGNLGLMQAVKKFDHTKGFRLSTYAMWWIKAAIHEYVLRSWTIVKVGTSAVHKKLFFNLKRMKNRIAGVDSGYLNHTDAGKVARELNVPIEEVIHMDRLMTSPDTSLDTNTFDDGDGTLLDLVEDGSASQESIYGDAQEGSQKHELLYLAMETLNEREKEILTARRLQEDALTLEDLSQLHGISRERVRQIETRAIEKVRDFMLNPQAANKKVKAKNVVAKVASKIKKVATIASKTKAENYKKASIKRTIARVDELNAA
jgi:RNA polymerase sigma-32 factor